MTYLVTEVITEAELTIDTEHGSHDIFAHYVKVSHEGELTEAYVMGTPVTALCGKVWVPTRDPSKHQVCPECREHRSLNGRSGGQR